MSKKQSERFRDLTSEIIRRNNYKIKTNFILSLINHESGGIIGRPAGVPAASGGRALGLGQVTWPVIVDFNRANKCNFKHAEDMGGRSNESARRQILVTCWLVNAKRKQVRSWLSTRSNSVSERDVILLSDTAYAVGWGATRSKLRILKNEKKPLTFDSLAVRFPRWAQPANNPIRHARNVLSMSNSWINDSTIEQITVKKNNDNRAVTSTGVDGKKITALLLITYAACAAIYAIWSAK